MKQNEAKKRTHQNDTEIDDFIKTQYNECNVGEKCQQRHCPLCNGNVFDRLKPIPCKHHHSQRRRKRFQIGVHKHLAESCQITKEHGFAIGLWQQHRRQTRCIAALHFLMFRIDHARINLVEQCKNAESVQGIHDTGHQCWCRVH